MKHISKLIILLAFVVSSNAWGNNALHKAASNGDINRARQLINSGIDVDAQEYGSNYTALILAVAYQQIDMVKFLLKSGANVNIQDGYYGETALMWAVGYKYKEITQLLLDAKTNLYIRNNKGENALLKAARRGDLPHLTEDIAEAMSVTRVKITSIKQLSNNMLQINWSVNDNKPLAFKLEHSTSVSGPYSSQTISSNSRTFYLYNMKPGKTHFFRLKARDKNGWGEAAKMTLIIPKRMSR